jgi:hypothetical protein
VDAESVGPRTIYDSLDDEQKAVYDDLLIAVNENRSLTGLDHLTIEQGREVRGAFAYDHPEIFWFYDCYTLMVYNEYDQCSEFQYAPTYTPAQIVLMKQDIDTALSTLVVDTEDPEHKRLKTIHDWICERITYTDGATHEGDIYGAIALGRAVCAGYAAAFTYLCHLYGFDCVTVTGFTYSSSVIGHAWNLVYGEGAWYFVDTTWDDDERYSAENDYFMIGSETKVNGRVFATEDHMADDLYGIVPATDEYVSPEEKTFSIFIIVGVAGIAILLIGLAIFRRYRRRHLNSLKDYVPSGGEFEAIRCPECGVIIDISNSFCPACGKDLSDLQKKQ